MRLKTKLLKRLGLQLQRKRRKHEIEDKVVEEIRVRIPKKEKET